MSPIGTNKARQHPFLVANTTHPWLPLAVPLVLVLESQQYPSCFKQSIVLRQIHNMPATRRSARLSAVAVNATSETSEVETSAQSNTSQQADTPASSPPPEAIPEVRIEVTTEPGLTEVTEEGSLTAKEKKHQDVQNARSLTRQIATARRKRKIALSPQERAAKAGELQNLLKQSAAFSAILTKKTQVLGRVGTALDGKSLGQHDLKMAEQPKILVGGTMRDYQLEGLTWMYEICAQGMSGILADEMGLGNFLGCSVVYFLLADIY